jgi:benzoate/toluate 1,2-dioxygenase reductase component
MGDMSGIRETTVRGVRRLSEGAFALTLEKPVGFAFLPGQSIRITCGGIERDYSVVSAPDEEVLTLAIRHVPGGALSPRLAGAAAGDRVRFTGPHGYFLFEPSGRAPVFVATGTGIAPFVSMARAGASGFILLHGVHSPADLLYQEELAPRAARSVPCVSGAEPAGAYHGRVTTWAERYLATALYDFYLCGNRSMIRDFTFLVDERFAGSRVRSEVFH